MADKSAMRSALKDVLMDLKKSMRGRRAARFKKAEEEEENESSSHESKESAAHEKAEAMGRGRHDDGGFRSSSSDREHGGRVSSASKGKDASDSSPFREEMMGFMTGKGLKARPGKSAPIIAGQKKPQAKRGRPKGPPKGIGA